MKQEEKFSLVIDKTELETLIYSLRDQTVSYERSLVAETRKVQPDHDELSFLGYHFNQTHTMLRKLEAISVLNNFDI